MDRRNSIKLILASAIAPAFIAQGLMKIKPVATIGEIGFYHGFRFFDGDSKCLLAKKMFAESQKRLFWDNFAMFDKGVEKLEENGINGPFKAVTQNAIYIKDGDLWSLQ